MPGEEGAGEGKEIKLVEQVCKKLIKYNTPAQIADALEEDADVIKLICEAAKECGPEYDYGKIHERLSERT